MNQVIVREETIGIPTYKIGEYSKIPMFLEKRVYQGSSGRVYPHPVCEHVADEKTEQLYRAVFLENEYLLVMILPEIGGRIQRIFDKTNGYDAVYYNEVIKPALVGLAGPWISGGIEFNWPQHHRPSTFDPVDYRMEQHPDGSATVWVGETEKMFRTKGMAAYTLYPGKAYLEIKGQLYNGTDRPQTFLWWANPAVAVNEHTQSVFPPDVRAVMDHGKRDVSKFPISESIYYKMDYRPGTDISRYKNIPVPTSYMAHHSDYDFVGNYDHGKQAGLLHVADHHISPGKKQWTWGNGDFGQAWDRNLTDENGPYIELMTGMFTDNQPDFTFLAPYEEKTFTQYFMPYKNIGAVKNATADVMLNLEIEKQSATLAVYTTSVQTCRVRLEYAPTSACLLEETIEISPVNTYVAEVDLCAETLLCDSHAATPLPESSVTARLCESDIANFDATQLVASVYDAAGNLLLSYRPEPNSEEPTPLPAQPCKKPQEIDSLEELYLSALHLEQYRHATFRPEDYYLEGFRRDSSDIRINNAYGRYLYHRGQFAKAEAHFRAAIKKSTWKNPNPYDCEPYYNLGLALKKQGKLAEAFDAFYKSIWDSSMQDKGFYQLAALCTAKADFSSALAMIDQSLAKGMHNIKARNLKAAILRHLHETKQAQTLLHETAALDPLDFGCRIETYLLSNENAASTSQTSVDSSEEKEIRTLLGTDVDTYIECAIDYIEWGMPAIAAAILQAAPAKTSPLLHYYLAYATKDAAHLAWASRCFTDYCFPVRLHDLLVLQAAVLADATDVTAHYLLGNLWYDKDQWQEAFSHWRTAADLIEAQKNTDATGDLNASQKNSDAADDWNASRTTSDTLRNAILHRNLALLYFNKKQEFSQAQKEMELALSYAPQDARLFFEWDQLAKQLNLPVSHRLAAMEERNALLTSRDDLYTEYITLLNSTGQYEKALAAICSHQFHPWEGGEGKIPAQYKLAHMEIAKKSMECEAYEEAAMHLTQALTYPHNLGEGKLFGTLDNDIYYLLGCVYAHIDDAKSTEHFTLALRGGDDLSSAMYYNDQPPEMFYYQALAAACLGHTDVAKEKFLRLKEYGAAHATDHVEIDYFAVSLPDFLIFETDLDRKNRVHTAFLSALGCVGLGETKDACTHIDAGLKEDCAHQGLLLLQKSIGCLPAASCDAK